MGAGPGVPLAIAPGREKPKSSSRRVVPYKKPITRQLVVEGVPLIVTLTDRALRFKVKRSHKARYSLELSGLFRAAILEARKRHPTELPQETMDLRVPRVEP